MKKTFAELFKKYRLRAEFEKLSDLGNALADKGLFYEDSIFSHWQKGTRIPAQRNILLLLLEIFIERGAITSLKDANEFFESANQGYLTQKEIEKLPTILKTSSIFQVPNDIVNFTGRKKLLTTITQEIQEKKVLFIHGSPGVGKTALAIRLGHVLYEKFSDGVLWYKVDSSRIMDILLSIAATFGENIAHIEDIEIRASVVRSILSNKKVLLILDSADDQKNLHLLLPNASSCLTIITSRNSFLRISQSYATIPLAPFRGEEVLQLFTTIFGKSFVTKNQKAILAIGEKAGNLPLAVHMFAKQLQQSKLSTTAFLERLDRETLSLKALSYEDKNLHLAIQLSYDSLSEKEKQVFVSLGIFEGKDFSQKAVAYINNISLSAIEQILENIITVSLIEFSSQKRYRIHPMIKQFAREKLIATKIYILAAKHYEKFFAYNETKNNFKVLLKQEADNIIYIFNTCYQLEYWDEVTKLWNPIEKYLDTPQQHNKIRPLTEIIETKTKINILQKILIIYFGILVIFWALLFISGLKIGFWNSLYNIFTFIPLFGGIAGVLIAKAWGARRSTIGKAIFFISFGLFCWGLGNMVWTYYNFFGNTNVPYPSLADIGFIPGYIFWVIGMIYVSYATGVKFGLREKKNKLFLIFIPLIVILGSYYFLIGIEKKGIITDINQVSIKFFLDLYYPTTDIINLTFSLIIFGISFKFFGGKYKTSLYSLLLGFACMYIADFIFSYTTTINTYYNGSLGDLMFSLALFLITFGVFGFYKRSQNIKEIKMRRNRF